MVPWTDSSFHFSLLLAMTPDRWSLRADRSMAIKEKSICPSSLFPWRLQLCLCTDSTVTEPLPVRLKQKKDIGIDSEKKITHSCTDDHIASYDINDDN